jgi:DNA polymerase/3'-5' exonuclease PolX
MDDFTITRFPTLVKIDGMGIKELREAYKELEGDAISQAQQLSETCAKLHMLTAHANNMAVMLGAIADSFEAGDQAAILLQAKQLAERRAAHQVTSDAREARVH